MLLYTQRRFANKHVQQCKCQQWHGMARQHWTQQHWTRRLRQLSERQWAKMYQYIDDCPDHLTVLHCMMTQMQKLMASLSLLEVSATLQATTQHNTYIQCAIKWKKQAWIKCIRYYTLVLCRHFPSKESVVVSEAAWLVWWLPSQTQTINQSVNQSIKIIFNMLSKN